MLFSGYIFDVEGTLVDSVQQNLLSLQVCLADFGISVPYELLQLYSGLDGDQTLGDSLGRDRAFIRLFRYLAACHQYGHHDCDILDGVLDSKLPEPRQRRDPGQAG